MAFTLAQPIKTDADSSTGISPTVTFEVSATAGNLIVVALGHRRSDAVASPVVSGAGATGLTRHYAFTDNTGGNKGVAVFSKIADGGETTFTSVDTQQWRYIAAAEFVLPSGASGATWHDYATAVANTAAATLTVGVPDPASTNSLAWVSSFARDSSGTAVSFDSGFSAASAAADFAVGWRDDAASVTGNNVTATYNASYVAALGSGVWIADGLDVPVPTGFTFTASGLQLDGAWSAATGADSYDWEVEEDVAGTWTAFDSGNTATLAFQVTTSVAYSTTYRARVRTDDGGVKSDWTGWVSATTPSDALSISGVQTEAVSLSWNETTSPYDIRRDGTTTIASGLTGTSYIDTDVSAGTTYTYEVRSDGGAWSSPTSVQVVDGGGGVFFLKRAGSGWTT